MKSLVFLSGLLLLFLIHHRTESVEERKMNLTTLARIINFFEQNYKGEEPYAVAINVPKNQCQGNFVPSNENFLTQEKTATYVKKDIYNTPNQFYMGKDLMAAGPWYNCKRKSKSVSVLLQNDSLQTFKNFAQRRGKDSCIVIYSVYSPCRKSSGYDIIPNLEILKDHAGIKAFVFKKVYTYERKSIDHRCSATFRKTVRNFMRGIFYRVVNGTHVMPTNEC